MAIGEICSREVVFVARSESCAQAARLMRENHVGSLVVVAKPGTPVMPVGMITDRDLAVGVMALGLDAEKTLVEAIASSLTELFAPKIHRERISGMLENYDFISDDVMQYFKRRLTQAPRDADYALDYVKRNARTPEAQSAALDALRFKCNVLWSQLDALYLAYYDPGMIPPGAFVPEKA